MYSALFPNNAKAGNAALHQDQCLATVSFTIAKINDRMPATQKPLV